MNATEIALDGANAMTARLQAELEASQKRQQNTRRERLDRFVAAALTGCLANSAQVYKSDEFNRIVDGVIFAAQAVLAELEKREKEGQ